MSKSIRAAVLFVTAAAIVLPGSAATAAGHGKAGSAQSRGEIGVGVSRGPQPYGTLVICAGRSGAPASKIKLIRKGKVVKSFRLSGCRMLSAKNGLSAGRYKVRHSAPAGRRTAGWISGGASGQGAQQVSSVSRSRYQVEPRRSMSTAGFLSVNSANWVTFTRTSR